MDNKNENMSRNEKAEFAVKILLEYAKENGINGRDTTDLSPLEKWLILRLYNVVGRSEQLVCDCGNKLTNKEIYFGQCLQCDKNIEDMSLF